MGKATTGSLVTRTCFEEVLVEPSFEARLSVFVERAREALAVPFIAVLDVAAGDGQLKPIWSAASPADVELPEVSLTELVAAFATGKLRSAELELEALRLDIEPLLVSPLDAALVYPSTSELKDASVLRAVVRCLEKGLSQHRERLVASVVAQAVAEAPDPIELSDRHATLFYVNAAWERFFGHAKQDVLGRSVGSVLRGDQVPHDEAFYHFTLASVVDGSPWLGSIGSNNHQGQTLYHEMHVGRFAAKEEGFLGNIAVRRDTSHRATRDQALAVAHQQFRAVLTAIPDGIAVLSGAKIYFANPAFLEMVESSLEQVVGREYLDFIHVEDRERFESEYRDGLSRVRVQRRRGQARFAEISGAGSVSFEGRPATILISRDITDHRVVQEQLARADKLAALGSLAAGVAHEVNNPLAYITLNMKYVRELLAKQLSPSSQALKLLDEALAGSLRIQSIVSELRGFAGPERPGPPEPVEVGKAVSSAVNVVLNEIRHRATLLREQEPGLYVSAREGQLVQVLVNILLNAAQAIPEEGRDAVIRVTTKSEAGQVKVVVQDTGVGVPEHALPQVFDAFFTSKPPSEGSGLGLAISKRIVTGLGGRIEMVSEEGVGTTVTVELPNCPVPAEAQRPEKADHQAPRATMRILVVDDEPPICRALRRILVDHDVGLAFSGKEALQLLDADPGFDLIFCDLMMPELSGLALYHKVRTKHPELRERFVFMTGGAFSEWAQRFINEANPRVLSKPFEPDSVLWWVNAVIGNAVEVHGDGAPASVGSGSGQSSPV